MIERLRKRFIRIATLAVAGVMFLLCLIVNTTNFISVNNSLNDMLTMISNNQGSIPPIPKDTREPMDGQGKFGPETPFSTRYFVLEYTEDGTLIRSDLGHIAAVTESDLTPYLQAAQDRGAGYGFLSGYKYTVVQLDNHRQMAVFLDDSQEMQSVEKFAVYSVAAMIVCTGLVYCIVVLCSKKAVAPVAESVKRQKQFITNASHELKTPITVIVTCLKLLEMEVGPQKWIDKARIQTDKLKELVNSLVSLARLDEQEGPKRHSSFAVSDAVLETAESFRELAENTNHRLEIQIAPNLTYAGDEYAIRQLVSILLDNAIKYAPQDTDISLVLEPRKRGIALRTENVSAAPLEENLDRWFDRFYRDDPARNEQTGGFGIGLSIARAIVENHNGNIHAVKKSENTVQILAELK